MPDIDEVREIEARAKKGEKLSKFEREIAGIPNKRFVNGRQTATQSGQSALAAAQKKVAAKTKRPEEIEAENAARLEAAKGRGIEAASGVREAAKGFTLEKLGASEEQMAERKALREQIFAGQQADVLAKQGAQERSATEALERRLAGAGLRGTGAAEKLAQVQERALTQQSGEQLGALKLGQSQQELAALDAEADVQRRANMAIEQANTRAAELESSLIAANVDAEQAKIYSDKTAQRDMEFKMDVLLPIAEEQFFDNLGLQQDQLKAVFDQLDLDKEVTQGNIDRIEDAERNKGVLTRFWDFLF
jgi:hypothetical protein